MPLALRRGRVASVEAEGATIELTVEVGGARRRAVGYRHLTGGAEPGDEVIVNVAAADLGLGGGGFDVVHANLTRGLAAADEPGAAVMKLNYSSLQHGVRPVEADAARDASVELAGALGGRPVAVLALHGQLEPTAWATAQARPGACVGFVQTSGGALPGALSRVVAELRARGLLAGHITAGAAFGGEHEAVTTTGALHAGLTHLGWDAALVGPGPGIAGSGSALGHGGLSALDSAHAALALGAPTVLVPRMSSGDPRERHRGLSHHSATVLELLLRPVTVAMPQGAPQGVARGEALVRHSVSVAATDLAGYRETGLSARTMGRSIDDDELFFAAALAGGRVLADEVADA
jgi:Protein of unknown function (DUF3866)